MIKNRIIKNASWIIIAKIAQSALSLLVTMVTARYLGPSNYGIINYAAAIVAFIAPVVQLGLGNIQVMELVDHPNLEGVIVGTSLYASLGMSVIGFCSVVLFSTVANSHDELTILVCAVYSIVLFFQGAELIQYWFQKKYLSKYYSLICLLAFFLISIYKIYLLISGKDIILFAFSNSIDSAIILCGSIIVYRKLGGQKLSFSKKVLFEMLHKSKHYILANLMIVIFTQTDKIMLQLLLGPEETGIYSAAITCSGMFNFIFSAVIDSARPTIFEHYNESKEKFKNSVVLLFSVIIYATLFVSIFVTAFSEIIINIIYGAQFKSSISVLRTSIWFLPFSFIGSIRNVWLLAENKQKWVPLINLTGAIANVMLNSILIPMLGANGAAVASLVTQIVSNVICCYIIKDVRECFYLMVKGTDIRYLIQYTKKLLK